MPEDILMAIEQYLSEIMGTSLNTVMVDYIGQPNPPYAIIHDGPETYTDVSGHDPDGLPAIDVLADGVIFVEVVAPSKVEARRLVRMLVRIMIDTFVTLQCKDGNVIHLRPIKADSVPMTDIGVATPGAFKRFVAVGYKQEFLSPGFPGG